MRTNKLFLALLVGTVIFASCKKEEEGEKFSTLSVEENKAKIEDSGIKMVNTLDDMKDVKTIDASISAVDKFDLDDPFSDGITKSEIAATINAIAGLQNGNVNGLYEDLKSAPVIPEDPNSILEVWEAILGTYSWNDDAESWDYTAGGDIVSFQFPSSETGTVNNAELIVSNYAGVEIVSPLEEEYTGDLPVSLNMELKVDNNTLMTYSYAASYNDKGIPTVFASDLTIEGFTWAIDITNNSEKVSANYKFSNNGETVMEIGGAVEGVLTEENYDANTEYCYDDYTINENGWYSYNDTYCVSSPDGLDDYWTETDFEEVFHKANANFQLFNIAIRGDININGMVNKMDEIYANEDDENFNWDEAEQQSITAVNEYTNLSVIDLSSNTIIAKAEAYLKTETDDWGDTYTYMDIRFVFGDDSYVDAETYFNDGFDSFINEINALIRELNADYNFGMDEI